VARRRILMALASFIFSLLTGCASVNQNVNLTYDVAVDAKGGSGELFLAGPEETYNAVKQPSGEMILGSVKGTDRNVVTRSNVGDWIMVAFMEELRAAGYNVKPINELPGNAAKGLKIIVSKVTANQTTELVTITTTVDMKIFVEIWKNGTKMITLGTGSTIEKKGIDRSEKPIELAMKETLQNALQQLLPGIINTLEK
jgi:hypothetical protein